MNVFCCFFCAPNLANLVLIESVSFFVDYNFLKFHFLAEIIRLHVCVPKRKSIKPVCLIVACCLAYDHWLVYKIHWIIHRLHHHHLTHVITMQIHCTVWPVHNRRHIRIHHTVAHRMLLQQIPSMHGHFIICHIIIRRPI